MPSPEGGPAPEPQPSTEHKLAIDTSELPDTTHVSSLEEERQQLGRERHEDRSKMGKTDRHRDPESGLDVTGRHYTAAMLDRVVAGVRHRIEVGHESRTEILDKLAQTLVAERLVRAQAESEAALEAKGERKGLWAKFTDRYNNDRKLRLALGLGTAIGAAALFAAGAYLPAAVLKGGNVLFRTTSAYISSRGLIEKGEVKFSQLGKQLGGDSAEFEAKAATMEPAERIKLYVDLLSPTADKKLGEEKVNTMLGALESAETADVRTKLEGEVGDKRNNLKDDAARAVEKQLVEDLRAERQRLLADKKALRLKRGAAAAIAAVAGGSGLIRGVESLQQLRGGGGVHAAELHGQHQIGLSGNEVGPKFPEHELHRFTADEFGQGGEVYTHSNFITESVNPGETVFNVAQKHLENTAEFHGLSSEQKQAAINKLSKMVKRRAGNWLIAKADMQNVIFGG